MMASSDAPLRSCALIAVRMASAMGAFDSSMGLPRALGAH